MATKKSQRIAIWVIAAVMTIGTLGAYFIVILESSNTKRDQEDYMKTLQEQQSKQAPDPTAFKVEGDVTELKVEDIKVGEGTEAKSTDAVQVHYKGTLAQTGVKFDSSYEKGEPVSFKLDGVIEGWKEGMVGMKEGGKRRLIIPSEKAYGAQGSPPTIPANADLVFEVELIKVNP